MRSILILLLVARAASAQQTNAKIVDAASGTPAKVSATGAAAGAGLHVLMGQYNATPPTLTTGAVTFLQVNASGQLITSGGGGGGGDVNLVEIGGAALAFGQATMADSLPVVLASDQSPLPVTGTFWQATQPVSVASLPLPTGAALDATLAGIAGQLPAALVGGRLAIDGSGVVQPVSGTVSISGTVNVAPPVPSTKLSGQQNVTGTAAALPSHTCQVVCVQHFAGGSQDYVYVGESGSTTSTAGVKLEAGQAVCSAQANTDVSYVVAAGTGSTVGWTCWE